MKSSRAKSSAPAIHQAISARKTAVVKKKPALAAPAPKKSAARSRTIPPLTANAPTAPAQPLFNWLQERSAGVLLHPTSLPGAQGIGTFDANLTAFLDLLKNAGFKNWQLCPLGPTGYGDSPYQCFSAFAGNPLLIDLTVLANARLLTTEELAPLAALPSGHADFGALFQLKWPLLFAAHRRYLMPRKLFLPLRRFLPPSSGKMPGWLDAYCQFRALKDHFRRHRPGRTGRPISARHASARRSPAAAGSSLR